MRQSENDILEILKSVIVEQDQKNLVETGRLSHIILGDDKKISFSISVSAHEADEMERIRQKVVQLLKDKFPDHMILVSLTSEVPKENNSSSKAPRAKPSRQPKPIQGVKQIIAVASGKGGVGKSTTTCNLALSFVQKGLKVGVVDADIYGPSIPKLFNTMDQPHMSEDGKIEPVEAYGVKLMSIGFMVEPDAAIIWRGPMVMQAINQMTSDVSWGELDILLIDMPPGTGDTQITIAQNLLLTGVIVVSTPQDLALIDSKRSISMFQKMSIPVLGLIENMATFICPHCQGESHIFGHGGARKEAERLNAPFLGEIPLEMLIREGSDQGKPVVISHPESASAQSYLNAANALLSHEAF